MGESNKFAHAAALAVAQNVGNAFNPLFLYGDTGLGKTHLMHAIAHFIIKNNPSAKVMYISSEAFVNDYINALGNGNITAFRKRYRNTDVLLIDDIQFFAKKESSQNEFFHTFNELFNANKQIVLSCDKPINEVEDIEKRLVSRFAWGMSVPIEMPDYETRLAILRRKAAILDESAHIGDEVLDLIARRFTKNVRRMEGALNKLIGYSSLINSNEPISLEKANYLLADDLVREDGAVVDIETIQKKTARTLPYRPRRALRQTPHGDNRPGATNSDVHFKKAYHAYAAGNRQTLRRPRPRHGNPRNETYRASGGTRRQH